MRILLIVTVLILVAIMAGCISNSPGTGSLVITSEPPGAEITLDDTARGTTPATIEGMSKGNHTLSLKYPIQPAWITTVLVAATGTTYIHYTLQVAQVPTNGTQENMTAKPNITPVRPVVSVTIEGINATNTQISVKGTTNNGGNEVILSIIPSERGVYNLPVKKIVQEKNGVFLWDLDRNTLSPGNYSVVAELPGGEYSASKFSIPGTGSNRGVASKEMVTREFKWKGPDKDWNYRLAVPKTKITSFRGLSLNNTGENALKIQPEDRIYMEEITGALLKEAADQEYDEVSELTNVIRFVRSIPGNTSTVPENNGKPQKYILDSLTSGDADVRELTSIALELYSGIGYPPVLIKTKSHTAVGVPCSSCNGTFLEFEGMKYYYVEPVPGDLGVGEVPAQWRQELPGTITPYNGEPLPDMNCTPILESSDDTNAFYRIHCEIKNKGTGTASNPRILSMVRAVSSGEDFIWPPVGMVSMKDLPPGGEGQADLTLSIPRSQEVQIRTVLYGDNFDSVETITPVFRT